MSVIRRHPVVTFFVLAYALTWAGTPWGIFFVPGVLVSAVIVVAVTEGLPGLRAMGSRLIRWRVSWYWYALALAVPLTVKFAALGLNAGLGAPFPHLAEFDVWYALPMALGLNIINGAPLMEEPSFRGWAQPKLQKMRTPLSATMLMAMGVTLWHAPLFFIPEFGSSPIEALATVAVTFWYAWLFNHASGSSLLTLIAHATEGTIETSTLWQATADTTRMTWLYCFGWCMVALVLLVINRQFWTRPPAPLDDDSEHPNGGNEQAAATPTQRS